jgi:hypothetical protein
MINRITGSNTEETLRNKISSTVTTESLSSRVFFFAQVINNIDPNNLNRIQVRIPVIDNDYYVGKTKDEGDKNLPWVAPFSNRFLDVPEVNAIIMVAVFDAKVPHFGRMYFDSFSDFTTSEYFDKLTPEEKLKSNWALVEDIFGINILGKPKNTDEFNAKENINYKVGIRGKGKNRILLDKESTNIVQNFNDKDKETAIVLTENVDIDAADEIYVTSKKSNSDLYHPVFDDPLFDYLATNAQLLQKIVTVLTTIPAISPAGNCIPGPSSGQLTAELQKLSTELQKFRNNGSSKKININ